VSTAESVVDTFPGWTSPRGMLPDVITAWRAFYRAAWRTYGVSPQFYRALYLAQSGRCYICQRAKGIHPDDPKGGGGRRLGIDHNHAIGNRIDAVRALVCTGSLSANTCNRLIARYSVGQLQRAAEVLTSAPAQRLRQATGLLGEWAEAGGGPLTDWQSDVVLTGWLTK
jgi:hypothetical protein